jgi:hypothetical protein
LPTIGAQHDLWVEDRHKASEVTGASRRQEGVHDGPLTVETDIGHGRTPDPATGTARKLARRGGSPANDRCDVVKRHPEHIVQHERDPLSRRERVQDNQQCEPD